MSYPNQNRLIQIYKTGGDIIKDSWRYNFSRIAKVVTKAHPSPQYIANVGDKGLEEGQSLNIEDIAKNLNASEDISLLMDAELPKFQTTNQWKAPLEGLIDGMSSKTANTVNGILTVLGGLNAYTTANWADSTGVTTQTFMPWVKNIKAWNGSTVLGIKPTFKFAMGQYGLWNAREEVVKPILNLIAPALPQHLNAYSMSGNAPNAFNLITEMIESVVRTIVEEKGANEEWQEVSRAWDNLKSNYSLDFSDPVKALETISTKIGQVGDVIGSFLEFLVLGAFKRYTYTVEFGNMFQMNRMLIVDADWSFSKEVDQYGLPVAGQVSLKMESTIPLAMTSSSKNNMFMRYKFDEQI